MSFKFNRSCWVESVEDSLLRSKNSKTVAPDNVSICGERQGSGAKGVEITPPRRRGPPSIGDKIAFARLLFTSWAGLLKNDEHIIMLFNRLEVDLDRSRQAMVDLGIVRACGWCDENSPDGSCCGRGLEQKYDAILLLINLMLGVGLPDKRSRADSCHFLGPNGCLLKVRHMLCVDYLCPDLEKNLGLQSLIKMQTVAGEEIKSVFTLHEATKKVVLSLE